MKEKELIDIWKREESVAHIHGWDFSHIEGRYTEETDLPWNYQNIILDYLKPEMKLLDIDTGGGEFLLSLRHPYVKTSATEAYPPNIQLCKETLLPLGIDFRAGDGKDMLPFDDYEFDIVINRHGDFNTKEIHRVLKCGGIFITEQVGAENDRELVELLLGKTELPFPEQYSCLFRAEQALRESTCHLDVISCFYFFIMLTACPPVGRDHSLIIPLTS